MNKNYKMLFFGIVFLLLCSPAQSNVSGKMSTQNTKHTLGIEEENGYRSIEIYIHFCNKKEFPLHVKKLQFQEKKFLSHQKNFQINFDNQRILRHVGTFCF